MNLIGQYELIEYEENKVIRVYDNIENQEYPMHWHNAIEIIMPLESDFALFINEEEYILNENEILIIPAGWLHHLVARAGRRVIILIDSKILANNPSLISIKAILNNPIYIKNNNNSYIMELLNKKINDIKFEYENPSLMSDLNVYIKILDFFASLVEYAQVEYKKHIAVSSKNGIDRVIRYIENFYMQDISLDKLSKISGYDKYYLSKLFHECTNNRLSDYINNCRINATTSMLSENKYTITEIAYKCGFQSIATFNRVFKKIIGVSPSEYNKYYIKKHENNLTSPKI